MATVVPVADDGEEFARPRAASGALYFDGEGRVMLVKPTYKPLWEIPGGYVQPGESPKAAAFPQRVAGDVWQVMGSNHRRLSRRFQPARSARVIPR
jgi:hypothetical protein